MPKPSRYYVDYEDPASIAAELDRVKGDRDAVTHGNMIATEDFTSLKMARAFRRVQNKAGRYACIYERRNLIDETPPGFPEWSMWDSEDEIIEDSE